MAKNDPPSSTVAYITLITRVFWPFLGGVIIFIKNMTMLHFSWKFHFHEKWDGRWFSSHVEGPASTARFTGGQVNENKHKKPNRRKFRKNNWFSHHMVLCVSLMTCPPVKLGSRQDPRHAPPLTPPLRGGPRTLHFKVKSDKKSPPYVSLKSCISWKILTNHWYLENIPLTCPPVKRAVKAGPSSWDENHPQNPFYKKNPPYVIFVHF